MTVVARTWNRLTLPGKVIFTVVPLLALHKREGLVLLISRHRDGEYLADLAESWGYRSVRGSTW